MTAERIAPNLSYLATTTVDSDVQALVQRPNDTAYKLGSLDKQIGKPLPGQVLNLNTGNLEYFNLNPQGLAVNPEFTPPSPAGPVDPDGRPKAVAVINLTVEDKKNGAKVKVIKELEGTSAVVWAEEKDGKYTVIIGNESFDQIETALADTNYHPQAIILPQFPTPTAIEGDITSSNEQVTAESEQGIEWQRYQYLDHDPDPRDLYNLNSYTGEEQAPVEVEFTMDADGIFHHTDPRNEEYTEDYDVDELVNQLCGEKSYFKGAICLYNFDESTQKVTFKIFGPDLRSQSDNYQDMFHNSLKDHSNIFVNLPPEAAGEEKSKLETIKQLFNESRDFLIPSAALAAFVIWLKSKLK